MILFSVFAGLLCLLMLAALELNKNALWGLLLFAALTVVFFFVYARFLHGGGALGKVLGWLCWLGCFAAVFFLSWPPTRPVPAWDGDAPLRSDVVSLKDGDVRGVVIMDGAVELYAGIPYAAPPVGNLRWAEPAPVKPWAGVLEADHFAPMSMQPVSLPIVDSLTQIIGYHDYRVDLKNRYVPPVSEDSLYVNVWKPAGAAEKLPVLVFIHGGSLKTGQPWYNDYAGKGLAAAENVVVVNMGYRLGVFGYYADEELAAESPNGTTGNYGLLDQIQALRWVRENIAFFGGDPDNVTLAGESAGSASVSALCTSPLARGLFLRVLLESSTVASAQPPHSFRLLPEALSSGADLKKRHHAASVADLRALKAEALVGEAETQHHITVDGYALAELPMASYRKGIHNEEAVLHGYNSEESGPFILFSRANLKNYEEKVRGYFKSYADEVLALYSPSTDAEADQFWAAVYGAVFFNYPHYCLNRLENECGVPVYEYFFSRKNGRLGPWHSGEMIYFYGNLPERSSLFTEEDHRLSRVVMDYIGRFCRSGDPNGEGLPLWEPNTTNRRLLTLDGEVRMEDERFLPLYDILDRMTGWTAPGGV